MAKLIVEVPDELMSQVQLAGYSVESILSKALAQYIANELSSHGTAQSRTWDLCGGFTVAEMTTLTQQPTDEQGMDNKNEGTDYGEHIDDVLYQGF